MSSRLGEILVKDSLISADQLKQALDYQKKNGGRLGTCLVKMGLVSDDDITAVLSRQYGVPSINLKFYEVDPLVIKLVPQETAIRYQIVPLSRVGSTLTIAMTDPTNVFAMDDIKFMTGFNVEPVVASESAISEAIHKFYGDVESVEELDKVMKDLAGDDASVELSAEEQEMDLATLEKAAEEAPIIKLVNLILTDAVKRGASDIHVEPYEKELRVRFRVDGILQNVMAPPMKLKDAITSRIKIMSKLDISEKRLPQDGRIMIKYLKDGKKKELDFRVSTVPTLFGEKIVLRLLDKENLRLDMTKLGFADQVRAADSEALRHGAGHWSYRVGQDEYAVFLCRAAEYGRDQHYDGRRSRRIPAGRNQSGADEGADWAELRFRIARFPAARPQHHSGRRNSRL
jgi:type IV pilus assembly protein PilB